MATIRTQYSSSDDLRSDHHVWSPPAVEPHHDGIDSPRSLNRARTGDDGTGNGSPIGRFGLSIRRLPVPRGGVEPDGGETSATSPASSDRALVDGLSIAPNALAAALADGAARSVESVRNETVAEPFALETRRRAPIVAEHAVAAAVADEGSVATLPVAPPTLPDVAPVTRIDHVDTPGLRGLPAHGSAHRHFEPPELISFGPPTTALILGRTLIIVAALLVGFAARRPMDDPDAADVFWPVVASAGVLALVGLAAMAYWCVQFAENGRRLNARVSPADIVGWTWAIPVLWAGFASLTFLRMEPSGNFDPYPAIAIGGLAVCLAVPTSRLQKVFRGMTRRPPSLFGTVFALDLVAVGAVWWRLMIWSERGPDLGDATTTSTIAFSAAGVLTASGLLYGWLALRAMQSTYERLGRIEARHRSVIDSGPSWFHSGFRPDAAPSVVETRPLINMAPLSSAVAIGHLVMGALLIGWAFLTIRTAFEVDRTITLAGAVDLDSTDLDRLRVLTIVLLVVASVTIAVHGVWGFLAGLDAGRVTVHAAHPMAFAGAFVPAPLAIIAGLVVGGVAGEILVAAGLLISIGALVRLNLMLITVSSHLGGSVRGFGLWTWLLVVTYLAALLERFVVSPSSGRLGLLAAISIVQGGLLIAGAIFGRRAMRAFERTLVDHPQVRRAREIRAGRAA